MLKACVDCKHYDGDLGSVCRHPELTTFDVIQGYTPTPARALRQGGCGLRAQFFEPRKGWFR